MSSAADTAFPERLDDSFACHLARGSWTPEVHEVLRVDLDTGLEAPARARHAAREILGRSVSERDLQIVLLLLTEIVTNAVLHAGPGGGTIAVHLGVAPARVRVEVYDDGVGFDPQAPGARPGGGLGLVIVDRAASRWGAAGHERHCVWFELDRAAA